PRRGPRQVPPPPPRPPLRLPRPRIGLRHPTAPQRKAPRLMEFFIHPWYMVAGGALISSPILIHLINRMRFKRIRWAAMEFLLKSQKRNKRRLIIEQLILLMLRCLLVLLAAFLVARYVGEALGVTSSTSTTHVVVIDDTL